MPERAAPQLPPSPFHLRETFDCSPWLLPWVRRSLRCKGCRVYWELKRCSCSSCCCLCCQTPCGYEYVGSCSATEVKDAESCSDTWCCSCALAALGESEESAARKSMMLGALVTMLVVTDLPAAVVVVLTEFAVLFQTSPAQPSPSIQGDNRSLCAC